MSGVSHLRTLASLLVLICSACAGHHPRPLEPASIRDPSLRSIHAEYAELVEALRTDPETTWHAGWRGNALVHLLPGRHLGLCGDWQHEVYSGLRERIADEGWRAVPIAVRVGSMREHHAVLIYDPQRVPLRLPDIAHSSAPAFVLDPWMHGSPDIYSMHAWLRPYTKQRPPFLIEHIEPSVPR